MFWKRLLAVIGIICFLILPYVDTPWNSLSAIANDQTLGLITRHFYFTILCWIGVATFVIALIATFLYTPDYLKKN